MSRAARPAILALLGLAWLGQAAPASRTQAECDLGITLALAGDGARAESVFVSLLSHSPRDPRAYNNLGNLHLLRGEARLALRFYQRAFAVDSIDPGIVLNQATALLLLGEEGAAEERAGLGIRMAGDARAAASLLGLRYSGAEFKSPKGADRAYLSREEVLALLQAAAGRVPSDSTASPPPKGAPAKQAKKRAPPLRTAGARAGDAGRLETLAYWKR